MAMNEEEARARHPARKLRAVPEDNPWPDMRAGQIMTIQQPFVTATIGMIPKWIVLTKIQSRELMVATGDSSVFLRIDQITTMDVGEYEYRPYGGAAEWRKCTAVKCDGQWYQVTETPSEILKLMHEALEPYDEEGNPRL